jgi:hypothetical protein
MQKTITINPEYCERTGSAPKNHFVRRRDREA